MKQFVAICIIIALFGCFGADPQKTGKEGKPLPDISLLLTDSITTIRPNNIPSDRPFILIYISPYCPYCKALTNKIVENMDDFKDINLYFMSAFPIPTLRSFISEHQLDKYPNVRCGLDSASVLGNYFEITGIPYTAIYRKDKTLSKSYMGNIYVSQIIRATEE